MNTKSGMNLDGGRLQLDGYPTDYIVRHYDTKTTKRIRNLRFAESQLLAAKNSLKAFSQIEKTEENSDVREAIIIGAVTQYFCVFQQGEFSPILNPKNVFSFDSQALDRHNEWRDIRDKKFNHPARILNEMEVALVLDEKYEFVDILTIGMSVPLSEYHDYLQILYQLIHSAARYVDSAVEKAYQKAKANASALSSRKIQSLPECKIKKPLVP